jgi:hypothetical protein
MIKKAETFTDEDSELIGKKNVENFKDLKGSIIIRKNELINSPNKEVILMLDQKNFAELKICFEKHKDKQYIYKNMVGEIKKYLIQYER